MPRITHTYVIMELSESAYQEIRKQLKDAGYNHAFHFADGSEQIDLTGIAIRRTPGTSEAKNDSPA